MIWIIEENMETIWEVTKGMRDKIIIEMDSGETLETKAMWEIGVGHMTGKLQVIPKGTIGASVTVDQGQVLEWVQIEIGLDVLSVESYDHFTRNYLTTQVDREVEQIQQMFNMDEDHTLLQMPLIDVDQVRQSVCPTEAKKKF